MTLFPSSVCVLCSQDLVDPVVTCPATIYSMQNVVTWPAPSATDDLDSSPDVSCVPPSGYAFPLGSNAVICTATDDVGNQGTCSFSVINGKRCIN